MGAGGAAQESALNTCILHVALGLWGLCSWILVNGLWGQLAFFVRALPEGNKLGAYMIAAEQLAYVFPLIFMFRKRKHHRSSLEIDILLLLSTGLAISFSLPYYWNYQAVIRGQVVSVGLLMLTFFAGAVCSSTGIVFFPYVAPLPKVYTSALATGSGLSGLVAALFTLVANSGASSPRIGIQTYYHLLSGVYVLSIIAFIYVRFQTAGARHHRYRPIDSTGGSGGQGGQETARVLGGGGGDEESQHAQRGAGGGDGASTPIPSYGAVDEDEDSGATSASSSSSSNGSHIRQQVLKRTWPILLVQFLLSALAFGVMPSILPIACAGYQKAPEVLMLSTVGYMIADPIGRFATYFVKTPPTFFLAMVDWGFASVLITCALLSGKPPLAEYDYGGALPFLANTFFSFTFAFTSTGIFCSIRKYTNTNKEAEMAYRWSAFMIQTGAFLGTFITLFSVIFVN